jgi:hypothetical protein
MRCTLASPIFALAESRVRFSRPHCSVMSVLTLRHKTFFVSSAME